MELIIMIIELKIEDIENKTFELMKNRTIGKN